ncbi:hypothetical protein Hbl1158_15480 (plasmid) [Halobaculum sp. CBA1158]|uniref:hypothetical protein n=1 Tax=Halobaculum sp. CBA1158 TaxID=2904243 RepID=UPI001F161F82|nr:hypothetical protein [Halobaculum sp. CBA1158]UIP01536.1 hypothetical protein Hbl1158_15480 [Halobaculum sp. CBA1158]
MAYGPRPIGTLDETLRGAGRRLAEGVPSVESSLLIARDRYARAVVAARTLRNRLRYAAPPEPYRLIRVDPADIQRCVELHAAKFAEAGVVAGGDWDRERERFADLDVFRAYRAHFEDGVPWEETTFYDRIVDELDGGLVRWGCRTEAEFRRRCRRLDDLYETIRDEGYRSQAELLVEGGRDPIDSDRRSRLLTERLKDEIAVHVGRDGEVLFEDGRNRLSIAKLLDLDSIPVRVLRRHADWQAVRDAYVRGDPAVVDRDDHPDLAPLSFGSVVD